MTGLSFRKPSTVDLVHRRRDTQQTGMIVAAKVCLLTARIIEPGWAARLSDVPQQALADTEEAFFSPIYLKRSLPFVGGYRVTMHDCRASLALLNFTTLR